NLIIPSSIPHDNNYYFNKCTLNGNTYYDFVKVLGYQPITDLPNNVKVSFYRVEFKNNKIVTNAMSDVTIYDENLYKKLGGKDLPDEKPDEKPNEKPEEKPGEKPDEKPDEKPGENNNFKRFWGENRYKTNKSLIKNWDKSNTIIICSGENYPDALSASPLAKKYNAPIMLVNSNLEEEDINEIKRLEAKKIILIGGEGVLNNNIKERMNNIAIYDVNRLGGANRYETCAKVSLEVGLTNNIVIASGEGFADSLSIAPIASQKGMPILLTQKDQLPMEIKNIIKNKNVSKCYVIGGDGVLSENVLKDLKTNNIQTERLSGLDRYSTNYAILNHFKDDIDFSNIYIANGQNFPDALSVSPLAAKENAPLIIT
ncbi:cell wall-binding repeat-containing protein, partial [Clostridium botulinum]|uniref:cell wall-binding repeat-containing protein n=1 Tax=Clostridium botulinum TaxID=1491 RepID=UPI000AE3C726